MRRTIRRNPERPIDWLGLDDGLTDEQRTKIQDQWVEYAKSGNKDLEGAYLYRADLEGADLRGADLTNANLTDANLRGANLTDANLFSAYLTDAKLIVADLTNANLTRAALTRADLRDANLTDANLIRAYLEGANLGGANLLGANFSYATLEGAILPNYFKLLRTVGLTDLTEIKVENLDLDAFFALRKFFRDRGQDEFGEFLEFEIRAEMDQVRREMGQ
jgi:uncharacterized protein YjbI with pentapeptide repeats